MEELFQKHKICAILRNIQPELFLGYVGAAFDGGVRMFEVALNSPDAMHQISILRERYKDEVLVGAGTAVSEALARGALDAGAQFLLTPCACEETLVYCKSNGIPLLPGVMTPTDVNTCLRYGFHTLKLFPAGDLPWGYIKSLGGPFDEARFVAVGGVTPNNMQEFFVQGFIGVGIGSNLIPKEYVSTGDWASACTYIRAVVQRISGCEQKKIHAP